ncbi:hypothetical protein ACHAXR_002917 [Thalassiosira sp. AJA248-18]
MVKWNRAPKNQQNVYYALKCVSKQKIEEKKQQHKIKREEDIMKSLVHPFIARCYNVMEDIKGKYFLMEALCGGELCELLYFENKFNEDWSMFYSASVLAAFAHMHERKVAYRDLKPENLVLDNAGYVKIVDFGLAKVIKGGQTYTFCGTPDYLAPEVILSEGHDWAVDYWGLGVLIYEMMEGVAPFYAENPMDTYRKALSGQVHIPDHFTVIVANLIKKLLHTDQSKRLGRTVGGTTAIMCHRWFANFDWVSFTIFHTVQLSFWQQPYCIHPSLFLLMLTLPPFYRMHLWITKWRHLIYQKKRIQTITVVRIWGEKKWKDLRQTFYKIPPNNIVKC